MSENKRKTIEHVDCGKISLRDAIEKVLSEPEDMFIRTIRKKFNDIGMNIHKLTITGKDYMNRQSAAFYIDRDDNVIMEAAYGKYFISVKAIEELYADFKLENRYIDTDEKLLNHADELSDCTWFDVIIYDNESEKYIYHSSYEDKEETFYTLADCLHVDIIIGLIEKYK